MNGPETTTFEELLPGRYDVYINVYAEDKVRLLACQMASSAEGGTT